MALINENSPTNYMDSRKFWQDEYQNKKTELFELEKLIYQLMQDPKKSYGTDTGQNSINVSKYDLPSLREYEKELSRQIEYLEEKLGIVDNSWTFTQAVPSW
jgi:hypothetical protein